MKLFCTSNMVIINACLSYSDFRLPSELLLKRYEKYLVKRVCHMLLSMRVAVGRPIMFCVKVRTIQLYMKCINCN